MPGVASPGRALLGLLVAAVSLYACSAERPEQDDVRTSELTRAAEDIVGFLRGVVPFERIRVADTVVLYLAPEGGGSPARVARDRLEEPASWAVAGLGGHSYPFVPPLDLTRLTTRVGTHFNCLEYPLETRVPQLADMPHVGTRLAPEEGGGCLQTWNLTLVFDPAESPPRLVAAVYDQWEW